MVFTFQRAVATDGGQAREGRWVITEPAAAGRAADVLENQTGFKSSRVLQSRTRSDFHATSSFANFARSVFCPTVLNRTTSFMSSSSGSTLRTVPTPNCGCLTRRPGFEPQTAPTDPRPRRRRPAALRAPVAAVSASPAVGRVSTELRERRLVAATRTSTALPRAAPGGISSMNRDGSLDWYSPNTRRRAADVSTRRRSRAGDAHVAEPPLFLELRLVVARARVRKQAFLEARRSSRPGTRGPWRCASSSSARARRASRLPRPRRTAATTDRRSRRATARHCAISYSRAAETSSARFSTRPSASSLRSSRRSCR